MNLPSIIAQALVPMASVGSTVHRDAVAANDSAIGSSWQVADDEDDDGDLTRCPCITGCAPGEAEAVEVDLAYHQMKVGGGLERDEVRRAHAEEVRAGVLS